jgi:hypothetical protein
MRVIHKKPWTKSELESYRQITFGNIVDGLREILDAMTDFELQVEEKNVVSSDLDHRFPFVILPLFI